jgi:hypothetical protein
MLSCIFQLFYAWLAQFVSLDPVNKYCLYHLHYAEIRILLIWFSKHFWNSLNLIYPNAFLISIFRPWILGHSYVFWSKLCYLLRYNCILLVYLIPSLLQIHCCTFKNWFLSSIESSSCLLMLLYLILGVPLNLLCEFHQVSMSVRIFCFINK